MVSVIQEYKFSENMFDQMIEEFRRKPYGFIVVGGTAAAAGCGRRTLTPGAAVQKPARQEDVCTVPAAGKNIKNVVVGEDV